MLWHATPGPSLRHTIRDKPFRTSSACRPLWPWGEGRLVRVTPQPCQGPWALGGESGGAGIAVHEEQSAGTRGWRWAGV